MVFIFGYMNAVYIFNSSIITPLAYLIVTTIGLIVTVKSDNTVKDISIFLLVSIVIISPFYIFDSLRGFIIDLTVNDTVFLTELLGYEVSADNGLMITLG